MKELGKYTLIGAVYMLLILSVISDAIGQSGNIRFNFTGEKSRIVFDLSGDENYTVTEDWLGKKVTISFPNMKFNKGSADSWNNYIVSGVGITSNGNGTDVIISTENDFKVKYNRLSSPARFFIDIYPLLTKPDKKTLVKRAKLYEARGDDRNAQTIYNEILEIDPYNSDAVRFLALVDLNVGSEEEIAAEPQYEDQKKQSVEIPVKTIENDVPEKADETVIEAENKNEVDAADDTKGFIDPVILDTKKEESEGVKLLLGGLNLENIIRNAKAENTILYILYSVIFALVASVVILIRKIMKLYSRPKKKKTHKVDPTLLTGRSAVKREAKRKSQDSEKQMQDIRSFAKKLSDVYSKTEIPGAKQKPVPQSKQRHAVSPIEEHTKKIEALFTGNQAEQIDSEAFGLIKRFHDNNVDSSDKKDKYALIQHLHAQNWEVWEIARELTIGTEEVKMALDSHSFAVDSKQSFENDISTKILQLNNLNFTTAQIAGKLKIHEEQVVLALKMRDGVVTDYDR